VRGGIGYVHARMHGVKFGIGIGIGIEIGDDDDDDLYYIVH